MPEKIAIYPGTFDPITLGHLDVLRRACGLFDEVIISAAISSAKNTMFTIEERMEAINLSIGDMKNCRVDKFDGLLVNYAMEKKASVIIRGLRAISDFEYEFQMALTNRKIAPDIETVFLMPGEKYSYISSTLVREVAKYGGDVSEFVPAEAAEMIRRKFPKK